jgi:hypothetical protein
MSEKTEFERELERLINRFRWVNVKDRLPRMREAVWILLPYSDQPKIGCRTENGEGWVWGRCYSLDDIYWTPRRLYVLQGWVADKCVVDDDYRPTHWAYLITPPEMEF